MKYDLPNRVLKDITGFSEKNKIQKVILFGSRARGTNSKRSDVDIAVSGGDFEGFYRNVTENAHSLLTFDIIDLDSGISEQLKQEIERDGVIIYEKA